MGREEWFRQIIARFETPLVGYARHLTGSLECARDVVQETFLQLLRHEQRVPEDRLAPWLYVVCRNRALDSMRKEKRMRFRSSEENIPCGDNPAEQLERAQDEAGLAGLLDVLTPRQREVIRLKFIDELSYKAISEITGLSVSNVGVLIHTGIRKMRAAKESRHE